MLVHSPSLDRVDEGPAFAHPNMHVRHRLSRCHSRQKIFRQFRQEGLRKNMIDVSGAAVDLRAARRNGINEGLVPGGVRPVVFLDPGPNPAELQLDDAAQDILRDRIVRHDPDTAEKRRLEELQQVWTDCLPECFRIRSGLRVGAQFHERIRPGVGRHETLRRS